MAQKKLMLLGGISYLLPAIKAAHKHGCHVITVDYLPDNIAHKYSDDYHNVNIIDKKAVLRLAKELKIDGILSYAVDPGVISAAYVAEEMGLPFSCSYKTACILQDKSLFRKFLKDNCFNVPKSKGYCNIKDVENDIYKFTWPVMVKPVDSAGSKGVTKVNNPTEINNAITTAIKESHNGHFIIEEFLEKDGLSSGSESFFINGKLVYNAFYDQLFDEKAINPFTPSAECWPANKPYNILNNVREQLQKLSNILNFQTGLFNIEWRLCKDGKVYLMEVSPRAGGNRLAEILNYVTDINIIDAEISKAIGLPLNNIKEPFYKGYCCILVLHSNKIGVFKGLEINNNLKGHILEKEIRVCPGDMINSFTGANSSLGTLFLHFETRKEMENALSNQSDWLKIIVES